jgi:hypothetical protein
MRLRLHRTVGPHLVLVVVVGCNGPPQAPVLPETDGPPDWIVEVAQNPQAFTDLLERSGRDGWVALHANQLQPARDAFSGDDPSSKMARARAEWQLTLFYEDLTRGSDYAHYTFLSSWSARELPVTPGIQTMSAQWRECEGLGGLGVDNVDKLPEIFKTEAGLPDALAERRTLHEKALAGDPTELYRAAASPLVVERAETFDRTFYDACLYRTLRQAWMARSVETTEATDWRSIARTWTDDTALEGRLFAPWLTGGDLEAEISAVTHPGALGATQPSLVHFGVGTETSVQDDVEVAREDVRALDAAIDLREKALLAAANDDGAALLTDLGLHHRFRQEWITTRARKALLEERPHQAMAYLELARNVSKREVGPANTPSVLALYAEAQMRLGRTREALDVLVLLEGGYPEVEPLKELVGDLAVLQGLDRQGDSKEN